MVLLRFSQTFTIIVNSGIPINEGLSLVAQSINNQYAREEIMAMKNAIQRGSSILQAASLCNLFTSLELQMLSISEQTGELGAMLNEIALYYQREVEYDLKHLTDIIEPLLLSGVALMVLFLALAVYMPIWNMVKLVHKG
jgi:MSHA biogenesis protein MshG